MNQLWVQDEYPKVKILELNSDDSDGQLSDDDDKYSHIWNNVNGHIMAMNEPDHFNSDYKSKEKNCTQNGVSSQMTRSFDTVDDDNLNDSITDMRSNIYKKNDRSHENLRRTHQNSCFTVLNKVFNSSDSSLDDVEVIEYSNTRDYNFNDCDRMHSGDILTLDEDGNKKSTIWIYSIKNKRVLSENTSELVNVPSQESTSSTSRSLENYQEEQENYKRETPRRVGSPIPATYIPRLNLLSPRLPTVTEVTEPIRTLIKGSSDSSECYNPLSGHKLINGWLGGENKTINITRNCKTYPKKSPTTDVGNQICPSPRERRRRYKHTNLNNTNIATSPSEFETRRKFEESTNEKLSFKKIETTAEINLSDSKSEERESFVAKTEDVIINDGQKNDKSDHEDIYNESALRKPKIIIQKQNVNKIGKISDPIDKLDNNGWICEEKTDIYNDDSKEQQLIDIETIINDQNVKLACPNNNAGNRLWARNTLLLRPAEWNEYRSIANSIPSLAMSIATNSNKHTWLCRLSDCFRCCK
ncbi:unnamed protein product [Diatraea saccharalis]|uniref:Uncharacterized protein n=1 Tax=Diatraea saccharalis TaxID=40085 RepID=A0A9N9R7D3_9NEOP|nr:unnamed protein product [Diatraea saccharalis]